jgi:predicted pyridoxine 5'-phosphate oxidase superfamily flavin-nucleotide-binding protein
MLNEKVVKLLRARQWDLATCSKDGMPNVVPVHFREVTPEGRLLVGDVFLHATLENIRENGGRIAISAYDPAAFEGYQIKGRAEYVSEGPIVDGFKKKVERMFNGAATAKGALVITPEKVIVTSPGADNRKEI